MGRRIIDGLSDELVEGLIKGAIAESLLLKYREYLGVNVLPDPSEEEFDKFKVWLKGFLEKHGYDGEIPDYNPYREEGGK